MKEARNNLHRQTVESFGQEWSAFDQEELSPRERRRAFDAYFRVFPFDRLLAASQGFDMGCGSGRWAKLVAPLVGQLHCIDASEAALGVAANTLAEFDNVKLWNYSIEEVPLPVESQDFGYSLGVLHHVPDTEAALRACVKLLKPGAPFLVYLYYKFDNRPFWYRCVWFTSDLGRRVISVLPYRLRTAVTNTLAAAIYFPLARVSAFGERAGFDIRNWPLNSYRHSSFYTMRTDSRDRFGTPLEHRFTREEIRAMMRRSGLRNIEFSDSAPFWCAVGFKDQIVPRVPSSGLARGA